MEEHPAQGISKDRYPLERPGEGKDDTIVSVERGAHAGHAVGSVYGNDLAPYPRCALLPPRVLENRPVNRSAAGVQEKCTRMDGVVLP